MGNSATILSEWPDCRVTVTRSQRHYCSDGVSPGRLSLSPGAHLLVLFFQRYSQLVPKMAGKTGPAIRSGACPAVSLDGSQLGVSLE
mgnify:CR=1 FL=1